MQSHNVPTIPGYQGDDQSEATIKSKAIEIGFPVLLKASAGGGGKGMRIVRQASELDKAINEAKSEALNGFGDDTLLIEKYFDTSRHVEFQIFGDKHGNALHLFERECSITLATGEDFAKSHAMVATGHARQAAGGEGGGDQLRGRALAVGARDGDDGRGIEREAELHLAREWGTSSAELGWQWPRDIEARAENGEVEVAHVGCEVFGVLADDDGETFGLSCGDACRELGGFTLVEERYLGSVASRETSGG